MLTNLLDIYFVFYKVYLMYQPNIFEILNLGAISKSLFNIIINFLYYNFPLN